MTRRPRLGTTLVELLAILAAIVVVLAVLLPSIARGAAAGRMLSSSDNVRAMGAAHAVYSIDWNGRQLTFVDDLIAAYGNEGDAFQNYWDERGERHPGVALGWGRENGENYRWFEYRTGSGVNGLLTLPIGFGTPVMRYFGAFRLTNAVQFNRYLGGRFYDETFYTPEDPVVFDAVDDGGCFDLPDDYCDLARICNGDIPAWSSYCLSPAAMFNPRVMAHDDPEDPLYNGWVDPWSLPDGFRSPPVFHALYPHLKTRVLEHHWIRGEQAPPRCNPGFEGGYEDDEKGCCEPFYFNNGLTSAPLTLFYDGHVAPIVVADAMADDERVREQQGNPNWGLWSKDTAFGDDGYLIEYGHDQAATSFHVLTTDGIRGRDVVEPASPRRRVRSLPRSDVKRPASRRPPPFASEPGAGLSPLE